MVLDLSYNMLRSIPSGVFDKLIQLTWLELDDNNVLHFLPSGVFDKLTKLKHLELDSNQLKFVPHSMLTFKPFINNEQGYPALPGAVLPCWHFE